MIIVDGMLLARRTNAKMDFLKNADGQPTGMEYGFLKTLKSIERKLEDSNIIVCWEGGKLKRKELSPSYKANRDNSHLAPSFWDRLKRLQKMVAYLHDSYYSEGFEADDAMGVMAMRGLHTLKEQVYIYTNDKDLLQIVQEGISVVTSHQSHQPQLWLWEPDDVEEKYGVKGFDYVCWKAFMGDKGDNVQGVERVRKNVVAKKIKAAEDFHSMIESLWSPEGYFEGEWERVMEFTLEQFSTNLELVRLHVEIELEQVKPALKAEFEKYIEELNIRSISYEEF